MMDKYKDDVIHWKLKYLKKVAGNIEPNNILEVGCYWGFLLYNAQFAVPKNKRLGIDISAEAIRKAKSNFPEMSFFQGSLNMFLKRHQANFDLIILSDILEHVEEDISLLRMCSDIGKYILINLPLEKCGEYKERKYGANDVKGHLRAYSEKDAFQLIKNSNLKIDNYTIKKYVNEEVFRKYLFNKLLEKYNNNKTDARVQFEKELLHIKQHQDYYKSNFFALLKK